MLKQFNLVDFVAHQKKVKLAEISDEISLLGVCFAETWSWAYVDLNVYTDSCQRGVYSSKGSLKWHYDQDIF